MLVIIGLVFLTLSLLPVIDLLVYENRYALGLTVWSELIPQDSNIAKAIVTIGALLYTFLGLLMTFKVLNRVMEFWFD